MKNKRGFTLSEMMVVVLIIAGLAAVAYPAYTKAIIKARVAEAFSLAEIVREGQQRSLALNGSYFSAFNETHVSGRTRLIKSNEVSVSGGKLKKDSYTVSIANVNASPNTSAVTNGCIIVRYAKAPSLQETTPIFTIYTHVEDSRIGCIEADEGSGICGTIPSAETGGEAGKINCSD